jgi:membrane peptidoglycan carboxypeptidase
MSFHTSVNYSQRKVYKSRFKERLKRARKGKSSKSWSRGVLGKSPLKNKIKKILGIFGGILFIGIFIATIFVLSVIAKYSSELPNPDEPFERAQDLTSYVYDRNGKELYKIHGDQNRDIVKIEDVPLDVQWAFIAAEDIDFYTHKGVDLGGVFKAALYECCKIGTPRGGSTITQQMIKNTVLTNERSYERKLKEIIMSLRTEQKYNKQQVLQLYLNEIGFGGNTYGVETAARVYFGKDVKELTLGEASLLAGLPQAPGMYSPLFASDITRARELAIERQHYVLSQMEQKRDKINAYARKYNNWDKEEDFLTEDMINKAREQVITYQTGKVNIEAPHFVFYVEDELQKDNYNLGKPFSLSEVERGGLKITTSIDLDIQHIAEETLKNGIETTGKQYDANNGALVTIDPKTGQILAMVGSIDYWGEPKPAGCTLGVNCKFEPKVNVAVALRQPGSSLKPMVYYAGFETGQLYPASFMPDIPITFGNWKPKNNEGSFFGPMTARTAVELSRNIPAVEAIEIVGVTNFLNTLEKFGYTSFTQQENFGDAVALGSGDVRLVEHTNAYAVLASGGMYHKLSPILKIEDKDGKVLYEYDKDESRQGVRVADEQAVYMINDVCKNYHVTPPKGYVFAGKTGTSDDNKNTLYMGYSPEFVTGIWTGNNDNSAMNRGAYGYTVPRPIWIEYTNKIIGRFPPTQFTRPGGIVSATVCKDSGLLATSSCEGISDIFAKDRLPPQDDSHKTYRVCSDQPDHLARPIDEQLGFAVDKVYSYVKAPKEDWQQYYDQGLRQGSPPTALCTVNRNPSGNQNPWVIISAPTAGTVVAQGAQLTVKATAYSSVSDIVSIDVCIGSSSGSCNINTAPATNNPFDGTIQAPSANGTYYVTVTGHDSEGRTGSATISIIVGDILMITQPASGSSFTVGNPLNIAAQHIGGATGTPQVIITGPDPLTTDMLVGGGGVFNYSWLPTIAGTYHITVKLGSISSGTVTITITGTP